MIIKDILQVRNLTLFKALINTHFPLICVDVDSLGECEVVIKGVMSFKDIDKFYSYFGDCCFDFAINEKQNITRLITPIGWKYVDDFEPV